MIRTPNGDTYRCESCDTLTESPVAHEHNRHDGAQTCWPVSVEA